MNLPDDLTPYYRYDLEYRVSGTSGWVGHDTLSHEPDAKGQMQEAVTGLQYGMKYDLRVTSRREVRGLTELTGHTMEFTVMTACLGR